MAKFLACILLILVSWIVYEIMTTPTVGCSKLEYGREVYTIC